MSKIKNKFLLSLLVLDIAWSTAALIYDWPKLINTPFYIWPIMIICPIYPLLLAYIWYSEYHQHKSNEFLYTLGVVGSAYFGASALIFYPFSIVAEGFDPLALGAIFWVLFYGVQGWFLLIHPTKHTKKLSLAIVFVYFTIKLLLDWRYYTFGYLVTQPWNERIYNCTTIILLLVLCATSILFRKYSTSQKITR